MLICIIALLAFVGLVAVHFLKVDKKIYIMAGMIILLLFLHIADELISPTPHIAPKKYDHYRRQINITHELYKNSPSKVLLKQERQLLNYLLNKYEKRQNIILCLKDIDASRFRAIFKQFQQKTSISALEVDFERQDYEYSQIEETLSQYNEKTMVYMLMENANKAKIFKNLESLYLSHNTSIIMRNPDQLILPFSSISTWMTNYAFEGNYVSQVLENHPPRLVQICSKYRTFDYSFYVLSQTEPISQLCTKLPSTRVTQCIREFMQKAEDRVGFSKVKHCWKGEKNLDGVIIENGMVGLKKDYFYAGKVDKGVFVMEGDQNKQL